MDHKYHPISLASLKDCFKDLPFGLYLEMPGGRFIKAFAKETGLDFARLANYEAKGVMNFYVIDSECAGIDQFLSRSPMMTLAHSGATLEMKKVAFWAVMEQSLFESFEIVSLSALNIGKSFEALKIMLQKDTDFINTLSALLKVCPQENTFFKHAISTALFCHVIAQITGLMSERSLKILLFASLFHDVGRMRLPESRRFAYQNKTPEEIAEFRRHPIMTLELMVNSLPFADEEIRSCILQHRERIDGKGFPNKLKGPGVYSLARVLAIGDSLSEYTLGMEDGYFYSRAQAISVMMADEGRYDRKLLLPFAQAILHRTMPKAG